MRSSPIEMGDSRFENHSSVAFTEGNHEILLGAQPKLRSIRMIVICLAGHFCRNQENPIMVTLSRA